MRRDFERAAHSPQLFQQRERGDQARLELLESKLGALEKRLSKLEAENIKLEDITAKQQGTLV